MTTEKYIIFGKTKNGDSFRPSDWAERISGLNSKFLNDKKLYYSDYIMPAYIEGVNSLIIEEDLKSIDRDFWEYVFKFAEQNNLTIKKM